jgi:tetratricopeptide (TPR) repeat protein
MSEHPDRNSAERRVRVRCATWKSFLELHAKSLSRGALFVRSDHPATMGSPLIVEIRLPDGRTHDLHGEVVQAILPSAPDAAGRPTGMGVRFTAPDAAGMLEFELLLREARQASGDTVLAARPSTHDTPSGDADFEDPDLLDALRSYVASLGDRDPLRAIGLETGALPDEIDARLEALADRFAPDWYADRSPEVRAAAADVTLALGDVRRRILAGDWGIATADGEGAGLSAGQLFGDLEFLEARAASDAPAPLHVPAHEAGDWIRTGTALLRNRRYREAEEMLRRALEADPTNQECSRDHALAQGHELRAAGRLDEAARAFERAAQIDPRHEEAAVELRAIEEARREGAKGGPLLGRFLRR